MQKTSLEIYTLAVCFVAVICFSINAGLAIYSTVGLLNPNLTLDSYQYRVHQTNDNFWQDKTADFVGVLNVASHSTPLNRQHQSKPRPPATELTQARLSSYQAVLGAEQHTNLQNLVRELIIVVVSAFLLLIHYLFILRKKPTGDR